MTRRFSPRKDDGETGAYAILYGVVLLAVCGLAAIVVDLGQLRESRRETRLAADAAAVAGARQLNVVGGTANPRQACMDAWSYLATNLSFTAPSLAASGCTNMPTTSAKPCTTTAKLANATVGDYTVTITWPVFDGSTLLTQPNVQPATPTQPLDKTFDGSDPCERIAVSVVHKNTPAFAGIFGTGNVSTNVSSVARATTTSGKSGEIAALNVLNQTQCQTVLTSGQGFIEVAAVGTRSGIISVESDGKAGGAGCGNNKYVIQAATNGNAFIRANAPGAAGTGKGVILEYALQPAPTGNPAGGYLLSAVPGELAPAPTMLTKRSGTAPVTDEYGCASGCSIPYISNLRTAYGGLLPPVLGYAGSPTPYNTLPFVPFPSCNVSATTVMPAANYYISCPGSTGLSVKAPLVFKGGNVVINGNVSVSTNSGCFAVNVPVTSNACPTVTNGEVTTKPAKESILYFQKGSLTRNGGSIFAPNTFTFFENGGLSLGGNTGTVLMTNPRLDTVPAGCDDTCQAKRFWKVSVWHEGGVDQLIGGQGSLFLRGVLFVPKSKFTYAGQAAQTQVGAQFWTDTIENSGQGGLTMAPNEDDAFKTPVFAVALIR